MMEQELLSTKRHQLIKIIQTALPNSEPHSQSFVFRMLKDDYILHIENIAPNFDSILSNISYGGYPPLASLGFGLGGNILTEDTHKECFVEGITRLSKRTEKYLQSFLTDDVAILGIADGLRQIQNEKLNKWFVELVDLPRKTVWSGRMRNLAVDLLDGRGRLKISPSHDLDLIALEMVLRAIWPNQFVGIPVPSREQHSMILKNFMKNTPTEGDVEKSAIWLKTLDLLIDNACENLIPTISDVSRILKNTEHSFKRWVWEDNPPSKRNVSSKWLIDREAHVQAFLWAVLYPIYGSELQDEIYLPIEGNNTQPRLDLAIKKLKLIIEVKHAREKKDFKDFEGQIRNDLGLYFQSTDLYDRMIVYIYDDSDTHYPEQYDSLRNALKHEERIEDVIIIRRPSMMPNRNDRK